MRRPRPADPAPGGFRSPGGFRPPGGHGLAELLPVGMGAIPGALLRWLLHCDPLANLLGCLLIGWLTGSQPPRPRRLLVLGVGFCGALTTFSGWVLSLSRSLAGGNGAELGLRLGELLLGVAAVALGQGLARIRR